MTNPFTPAPDDRRGFLAKLLAISFGAAAMAVPAVAAVAAFFNPWRGNPSRGKSTPGKWVPLAKLDALPEGQPQAFPVIDDRWDAWNYFPGEPIGTVFLCRGKNNQVRALQSICPHNGGGVMFDAAKNCFVCPTHGALFDAQGRRLDPKSVSPRDLDALEVEVREDKLVWVKFEKFQDGTAQKIVKS